MPSSSVKANSGSKEDEAKKKKKKEPTKVVVRHLPPTMTRDNFMTHIGLGPLQDDSNEDNEDEKIESNNEEKMEENVGNRIDKGVIDNRNDVRLRLDEDLLILEGDENKVIDLFYFENADLSLQSNAFCRAYLNFKRQSDLFEFTQKYDNYVFVDDRGHEYVAIVEYAPFQALPNAKMADKEDAKCSTIEDDPDFKRFMEDLEKEEEKESFSVEHFLEEMERKEKAGNDTKSTPLLDFMKERKERRDERRRREDEKRKARNATAARAKDAKKLQKKESYDRDDNKNRRCNENESNHKPSKEGQKKQEQLDKPMKNESYEQSNKREYDNQKGKRQGEHNRKRNEYRSNDSGHGSAKGSKSLSRECQELQRNEKSSGSSKPKRSDEERSGGARQQQKQIQQRQREEKQEQNWPDEKKPGKDDDGRKSKRYSERRKEGFAPSDEPQKLNNIGTNKNSDNSMKGGGYKKEAASNNNRGSEAQAKEGTRSNRNQRPEREYYRPGQSRLGPKPGHKSSKDDEGRTKDEKEGQGQRKNREQGEGETSDGGFRRAGPGEGRGGSRVFYSSSRRGKGRGGLQNYQQE